VVPKLAQTLRERDENVEYLRNLLEEDPARPDGFRIPHSLEHEFPALTVETLAKPADGEILARWRGYQPLNTGPLTRIKIPRIPLNGVHTRVTACLTGSPVDLNADLVDAQYLTGGTPSVSSEDVQYGGRQRAMGSVPRCVPRLSFCLVVCHTCSL
jgi:hypothetical protein